MNDPSAFIEYSNTTDNACNNIDDYNPKRKRKILIVFDDMIADIMTGKRFQAIIRTIYQMQEIESLIFITQSYFSVPKKVRLNSTHYLIVKIHNKRELQQIAVNHSADTDYKEFLKICSNYAKEPYSFFDY